MTRQEEPTPIQNKKIYRKITGAAKIPPKKAGGCHVRPDLSTFRPCYVRPSPDSSAFRPCFLAIRQGCVF
jgi:hypothetical protein